MCALLAVWLLAPILVIIPLSLTERKSFVFPPTGYSSKWFDTFWSSAEWVDSTKNSVIVAVLSAVVATVVGTSAALAARLLSTTAKLILTAAVLLPMIIPGVFLAIADYFVFLQMGLVGTYLGFVVANSVLALPLVYLPVAATLAGFDSRLELAAASLGANRWVSFKTVTLPLILPGVLAGAAFAFVTAWDEVLVALFISDPQLTTLPVRLYQSVTLSTDPTVAAVSTLIIAATTVAVVMVMAYRQIRTRSN